MIIAATFTPDIIKNNLRSITMPTGKKIKERTKRNECWNCKHKREVPGNAHIRCDKPDKDMEGNSHGIRSGWFFYPMCFDPTWKEKDCSNYEEAK